MQKSFSDKKPTWYFAWFIIFRVGRGADCFPGSIRFRRLEVTAIPKKDCCKERPVKMKACVKMYDMPRG